MSGGTCSPIDNSRCGNTMGARELSRVCRECAMRYTVIVTLVSFTMLLIIVAVVSVEHVMQAETIAEKLAPQIGVDEDDLRTALETLLCDGRLRRIVVYCGPLGLLSCLHAARLIAEIATVRRERRR